MGISITSEAAAKCLEQISQTNAGAKADGLVTPDVLGLRIMVNGGGCAGFEYQLGFENQLTQEDDSFTEHGLTVIVDSTSLPLVDGSTLRFENGLNGHGFRIDNPNASGGCGCGQSFSVPDAVLDGASDRPCGR